MKIRLNGKNLDAEQKLNALLSSSNIGEENHKINPEDSPLVKDGDSGAQACILPESHIPRTNLQCYRLYFSENIKQVCRGDPACLIEETIGNISTPKINNTSVPFYWRVDTVLTSGEVMEGRVWSI